LIAQGRRFSMSKIRVLSDHVANQIAAGEVVERPASVAKELVENSIDAGARRITVDIEAGGRKLLRIIDDGEGMTRDDAVLAFERHATSKISNIDDLTTIQTLGFRGEALASIASVARIELLTQTEGEPCATRVLIEGGKLRDVQPAAHPRGTTITVRDLFFNVPARRKFLRSEATESFHLVNLVTHYALAHPEIAFTFTNNGREVIRAAAVTDLRERAYQIFGGEILESLLEVNGGFPELAQVRGFVSAPRERRTSRDSQYLFINGRYVRDKLIGRALTEAYRTILPHGVYPVALLFIDLPTHEVDVNVHPAKTEVRFRRAAAISDVIRETVRSSLASAGYLRANENSTNFASVSYKEEREERNIDQRELDTYQSFFSTEQTPARMDAKQGKHAAIHTHPQETINFGLSTPEEILKQDDFITRDLPATYPLDTIDQSIDEVIRLEQNQSQRVDQQVRPLTTEFKNDPVPSSVEVECKVPLPPFNSIAGSVREIKSISPTAKIRPICQIDKSYIVAMDEQGLLLIDQHAAHERILFDKYFALESARQVESQNMLVPETFDLTPAQAVVFDEVASELESYGFGLMRLSGRTVAIKAVPADLPPAEAKVMLAEILDTADSERRGKARSNLKDAIAASLACHAAIKVNTPLVPEKMSWIIDRLLMTSSPTTCPHGRPSILRLTTRDIEKGFHRP
jgi:DNA mismatch repair protein MutL